MRRLEARLGISLDDEGVRWRFRHAITDILRPWFAARRVDEFAAHFDAAGLTWSEFRTVREAMAEDPCMGLDNPMFSLLDQPGLGAFPVPAHPATFTEADRTPARPAPALGQDTEAVLGDTLCLTDGEIARLFDTGVVASPHFRRTLTAA